MAFTRFSGLAGVAFVVLVVAANLLIGSSAKPGAGAPLDAIVAYYGEHGGVPALVAAVAPFIWVALPLFAVGVLIATSRAGGGPNPWGVVGVVGAVMQNAIFAGVVASDAALAARAVGLAAEPQFARALWDWQHALFTLNGASLALALGGFALAVLTSGGARWLGALGLAGAGLLLASATLSAPALAGSSLGLVGLPGFLVWLVWIAAYGVVLARGGVAPALAPRRAGA